MPTPVSPKKVFLEFANTKALGWGAALMNKKEFESWRNENATSPEDKQGLRYVPFCFTEQGVTMLSCILNSERAIEVNIRVIRIFSKMREMLLTHKDILLQLEKIKS